MGQVSSPYVQHIYNCAPHTSTCYLPFEVCYGFKPTAPSELPVAAASTSNLAEQAGKNKAAALVEHLLKFHNKVSDVLRQTQANYKELHE